MTETILITGATGFVGHHCVEHFLKNTDWDIIAMTRNKTVGDVGRLFDSEYIRSQGDRIKLVYCDLNQGINESIRERIGTPKYVLHLAANSHVDRSITHPLEFAYDNVVGSVNLLEWVRLYNPTARVINFGTDEIFGPTPDLEYNFKEDDPWNPSNPYSAAKAGQIAFGIAYVNTYDLDIMNSFTMNIFGERQNEEKLVPKAMRFCLEGKEFPVHSKLKGELEETTNPEEVEYVGMRHWLHARNAADAMLFLFLNGKKGEKYNIVGDVEKSNDEIVNLVGEALGHPAKLKYVDFHKHRPGHDRRYGLDGTKLAQLGWVPPVSFEEGLKRVVDWTLSNQ